MSDKTEVTAFCDIHHACSDGKDFATKYTTLADVYDQCPRGDWIMWMLRKAGKIDKKTAVKLACEFALRVLPIHEKKYSRKEPREAIEAALAWIEDPTEEKRLVCRNAANDADAANAADAADAYADAAYAAYAANAAANAAYAANDAYAADAADAYAASADAAANAARRTEQQAQADIVRSVVKNPWRKA